jgi:O-antigen ligase
MSTKKIFDKSKNHFPPYLSIGGVIITLIFTPWFNKDSIAIPKQVVLFTLAMYFLPSVVADLKRISNLKWGKIFIGLSCLVLIDLILIIKLSGAPLDQQIYGRDGRLLGFVTYFSLIIILIASIRFFNHSNINCILNGILYALLPVSVYAIAQSFGLDLYKWESRTNQVISTIGNPNFVSAFSAFALLPSLIILDRMKYRRILQFFLLALCVFTIYRTQSIQGYIAMLISIGVYLLIIIIYSYKRLLIPYMVISITLFTLIVLGTTGHGPISNILYKVSVQSRGDFWRAAFTTANDNPFFGVGLDSFGDHFLFYRDQIAASHEFAEYTDSAHNYLLDYASFGGYIFAALQILIIVFTIFMFIKLQIRGKGVDARVLSIFAAWVAIQATLLISPQALPIMYWSTLISGAIIGLAIRTINTDHELDISSSNSNYYMSSVFRPISVIVALVIMFPLFNVDRMYLQSLNNSDGNLGIKLIKKFPKSTNKMATVGRLLYQSGEYKYSLEVARKFVQYNPNTPTSYALILINPLATIEERISAKESTLKLDPFNRDVKDYQIIGPSSK